MRKVSYLKLQVLVKNFKDATCSKHSVMQEKLLIDNLKLEIQ